MAMAIVALFLSHAENSPLSVAWGDGRHHV